MLQETWLPDDFRATINGKAAPVLRVNHAFKGVAFDQAGDYRITFEYWPRGFERALIASAIGLFVFVFIVVYLRTSAAVYDPA